MVSRAKTIKYSPAPAKPKPPAPTAAKKPSPKKPKIVKTVPKTATVVSAPAKPKPTVKRKVITQQPAGQAVQAQFKQAVSSAVQSVGIDFGVATVKTTVQETPTEIITITEKPEEEVIIEEEIPEEIEIIEEEEILDEIQEEEEPEIFGEIEVVLTDQVKQIITDIENGVVLVPDWFVNNIDWVKTGQITQQEFVTAYNYAVDQGWIHAPTEQEKEVIEEKEKEKEVTKKPSPKNGPFSGTSALGLVAVLVLMGAAVTVFKKEGN